MSWRERLQIASWRGVEFEIESDSIEVGRRVVRHTFPRRDLPYHQDMGRLIRSVKVDAFVIGEDYDLARDALVRALEQPGLGVFIHPRFGRMTGTMMPATAQHTPERDGRAGFSLEFEESGELGFLVVTSDPAARVAPASQEAAKAAQEARAQTTSSVDAYIASATAPALADVYDTLSNEVALRLGLDVAEVFDALKEGTFDALFATIDDLARLLAVLRIGAPVLTSGPTPTDQAFQAFADAVYLDLCVQAAARAAAIAVNTSFASWDVAESIRVALVDALVVLEGLANTSRLAIALRDLRIVTALGIEDVGARLPREQTRVFNRIVSLTPLAYELYQDADRVAEIIQRNGIFHPGFVAGPVTLLAR